MPPGPRPTSVPSGILIHLTVWPHNTNVRDRQTGQTGQRSRGIGRTVTCNGRSQKPGIYTCVPRYMDKSNRDRVEAENSFALGVIGVAVSGPEEATSGLVELLRETTTSGLTETANTAVLTRSSTIRKPLDDRKLLSVTCSVEYSLPIEPEVVLLSSADVPYHFSNLLATTQRDMRITGQNRPLRAISGQTA